MHLQRTLQGGAAVREVHTMEGIGAAVFHELASERRAAPADASGGAGRDDGLYRI